jgi:hypothetical protein
MVKEIDRGLDAIRAGIKCDSVYLFHNYLFLTLFTVLMLFVVRGRPDPDPLTAIDEIEYETTIYIQISK